MIQAGRQAVDRSIGFVVRCRDMTWTWDMADGQGKGMSVRVLMRGESEKERWKEREKRGRKRKQERVPRLLYGLVLDVRCERDGGKTVLERETRQES